jgi:hypothetical protein
MEYLETVQLEGVVEIDESWIYKSKYNTRGRRYTI